MLSLSDPFLVFKRKLEAQKADSTAHLTLDQSKANIK